ncbi:hypothetical protein EJ04DRAFT_505727 [Polyplosphaeria fusca]|uniref:Uncharacterized protein n=1 Tax=Polyplosphaeria fusca TaxID=682080 RepID=A0A9P4QHK3_9PLEO|nr:hypothetical protein EJ04DRAFT_505727 [Polyplosphaeria fusca]
MDSTAMEYPTAKDWQDAMRNNCRYKMHEIIERLGLKANWSSNKRGKTNFDSQLVKALVHDMSVMVAMLPKEHRELHVQLSAEGSLKDEVATLLQKHGPAVWGPSPRDHLVKAGSADVEDLYYPKDLYYDKEEDRSLIRVLLHWWMGQKAFNVILARERMDRERKKKEMLRKARAQDEGTLLERTQSPRPQPLPQLQNERPHTIIITEFSSKNTIQQVPATTLPAANGFTPINSSNSQPVVASSQTSATAVPALAPTSIPFHPASERRNLDLGNFVSNFLADQVSPANSQGPPRSASPMTPQSGAGESNHAGLDADTLRAFRRYIYYDEEGPECEEELLLHRLEKAWRDIVRTSKKAALGNAKLFAARDRAFLTWLELRRHLAELDRIHKEWNSPSDSSRQMENRIRQHRALMSASREVVRNWQEIAQGVEGQWAPSVSADDLLVQAFVLLAGESNTPDLAWGPLNEAAMIKWLSEKVQQFADEHRGHAESAGQLFYLG